jgi:catechol 2,3-dioxygenase-like lactoylglutathione lyase family enzyme
LELFFDGSVLIPVFGASGSYAQSSPNTHCRPANQRIRRRSFHRTPFDRLKGAMTETLTHAPATLRWYTRPVLFVADVRRALGFYLDGLGFQKAWHEGDGAGGVCQVYRDGCEIILCEHADRKDKARLYIELTADGLADLRRTMAERSIPGKNSWWGSDVIRVDDPDGNELLFPLPNH